MAPTQLFVKGLDGATSVANVSTLGELRAAAAATPDCRLVVSGRDLVGSDGMSIDIAQDSTVYVLARLLGGGKKRKKKTYTKPKKIKHKHKKEKLAVLKYYKVGGDGKIERVRRECPEEVCGPGVFMAAHTDRFYCGRCALTLVGEEEYKAS